MTDTAAGADVGLLVSRHVLDEFGGRIREIGAACGRRLHLYPAPASAPESLDRDALFGIDAAFYSRDVWQGSTMARQSAASAAFFQAADAAPKLRWLHLTSAGADLAQFPQYAASVGRGLRMSTSSGSNAVPIAQTVVAAVLAHGRGFMHWLREQRECRWSQLTGADQPRDLSEQSVVIIGMGPIGRETGRLLKAVGMRTIGIRRAADKAEHFDEVHRFQELDRVLPQAGFVVLACPLTDETRGLLGASRLALLPTSAMLVNVGRGELVDEAALIDRLSSGKLRGAYLDVFSVEPLPKESPLWALPNVWISPHNCSASQGNARRVVEIFLKNLERWLRGEPLLNEVGAARHAPAADPGKDVTG